MTVEFDQGTLVPNSGFIVVAVINGSLGSLDRIRKDNLEYGLRKPNCFYFAFEAAEFYEDRSGRAEVRLFTPKAGEFVRRLDSLLAER